MRHAAYILTLVVIWTASMAAVVLGLDGLEHPPFIPYALIAGGYFGAITTVTLAEEIAEAFGGIHPGLRRRFFVCSAGVAQRQLPGS